MAILLPIFFKKNALILKQNYDRLKIMQSLNFDWPFINFTQKINEMKRSQTLVRTQPSNFQNENKRKAFVSLGADSEMKCNFQEKFIQAQTFLALPFLAMKKRQN